MDLKAQRAAEVDLNGTSGLKTTMHNLIASFGEDAFNIGDIRFDSVYIKVSCGKTEHLCLITDRVRGAIDEGVGLRLIDASTGSVLKLAEIKTDQVIEEGEELYVFDSADNKVHIGTIKEIVCKPQGYFKSMGGQQTNNIVKEFEETYNAAKLRRKATS
jgi:hypothetical protein